MEASDELSIRNRIAQYEQFLSTDPENQQLLLSLGDLYHQVSDFSNAVNCYQKTISIAPNAIAQGRLGAVFISQQQFDKAEEIFRTLLDKEHNNPALLFNLGLSQYYQRNWESAKDNFTRALEMGAEREHCLPYLAQSHHHLSQYDDAIAAANEWKSLSNSNRAKGYLALLQMDSGQAVAARELAYEVLKEEPDNSDAAVVVSTYEIEEQEIEAASERLRRVLAVNHDSPRAMFALGLTHLHQLEHDKAISLMEKASAKIPSDTGMKVAIAWAKTSKKDWAGAEKAFLDTIATDRSFADGHGGLAYIYALQGKVDLAKEELKTAQWLDPSSFGAVAAQSVLLGLEQGSEKAVNFLANALETPPGPGQKPIIEHIRTYMKKYGNKGNNKPLKDIN